MKWCTKKKDKLKKSPKARGSCIIRLLKLPEVYSTLLPPPKQCKQCHGEFHRGRGKKIQ